MNKKIIIIAVIAIGALFIAGYFFQKGEEIVPVPENGVENAIENNRNGNNGEGNSTGDKEVKNNIFECLADSGVVIYGTDTCPACRALIDSLGGYEKVAPIYIECNKERERCSKEMQTNYVPEIQINGEIYTGPRSLKGIAEAVGCNL